MEDSLKLILDKLNNIDSDIKELKQGQMGLEQGQMELKQGQMGLEQGQMELKQDWNKAKWN